MPALKNSHNVRSVSQRACLIHKADQRCPATETHRQSGERPADVTPYSLMEEADGDGERLP